MNTKNIVEDILKSASLITLSPGVSLTLKDTKDKMGYEIVIEGSFRHGGDTKEEVTKVLKDAFKKIDIDV